MHTHLIEAICIFMKKCPSTTWNPFFRIIIIEQWRSGYKAIVIIVALCKRDTNENKALSIHDSPKSQRTYFTHYSMNLKYLYLFNMHSSWLERRKKMIEGRTKTKLKLILNMHLTFADGFIQSIGPNLHFCHHLFSLHCRFDFLLSIHMLYLTVCPLVK